MRTFDNVWVSLEKNLSAGIEIKKWTAFKGYLGDSITIAGIRENYIEIEPSDAGNIQIIPKGDFEKIWKVWVDYKIQKVRRYELRDITRFSTYIISILHWLENYP